MTRTYSRGDGTTIADVKTRVFRAITEDVAPDPRDAIIIGLVNACDGFRFLLPAEEYEKAKERIELLGSMDLFTRTIAAAVAESAIRLAARAAAAAKPIPRVKLLGMIARRSLRQGNLPRLMAELHQEYGPVLTIRPPFAKRGLTVLAGAGANTWVNRKGRFHLRTKDLLADWEKVYGASRTLPGLGGAEHYRLRRAQQRGYSRGALAERLDELFDQARAGMREWRVGDVLPGASSCKSLMGSQISRLAVGVDTSDYILDLVSYKERSLVTHVQRSLPRFMLKTPGMKEKRKKILELFEIIRAAHAPGARKDGPRDFVDDMMSLHVSDPQFLPETDLLFCCSSSSRLSSPASTWEARWVELQMVANLLLIAHHFTLDLHPPDYRIGYNPFPTSSPDKKLRFAIKAIRHPLGRSGRERPCLAGGRSGRSVGFQAAGSESANSRIQLPCMIRRMSSSA